MTSAASRIVRNEAARDRIFVLPLRTLSMTSAYLVSWWCVNDLVAFRMCLLLARKEVRLAARPPILACIIVCQR